MRYFESWVENYRNKRIEVNPASLLQFSQLCNLAFEKTALSESIIQTDIRLITYISDSINLNDITWYERILSNKEPNINKYQLFTLVLFLFRESMQHMSANDILFPWILTYFPPNIIERVSNQSSSFIYQLHTTQPKDFPQQLSADYVIEVSNKPGILKELDYLGINQKFIFNDYDSIAKYIRDSWQLSRISVKAPTIPNTHNVWSIY